MLFDYHFIDHDAPKTLVLLHGTGGTKHDLLFLDHSLQGAFNLLALQGNVLEQGMARFFRRLKLGVFDQQNIKAEAEKLQQFITDWCITQGSQEKDLVFLGYSNGANMILAFLFHFPQSIHSAVLLHPMLPFKPQDISLKQHTLFVTFGENDPMILPAEQEMLIETLKEKNASMIIKKYSGGHELSPQEVEDVVEFLCTLAA